MNYSFFCFVVLVSVFMFFILFYYFVLFGGIQRKPSLSSPPVSPVTGNPPIHRQTSAPSVLLLNHSSKTPVQALPLPPPRSRKRSDVPTSHAPKVKSRTHHAHFLGLLFGCFNPLCYSHIPKVIKIKSISFSYVNRLLI